MNTTTKRWLARASFALMLAAVVLVLAVAGWRSLALVAFALIGVCAVLAGGYWFLANRGVLRWLALVLVIAAPVLILVVFALHHLVWVAVVAVALMVAAAATARAALSTGGQDAAMPAVPAARPRRPFVIMNPRSGGGKVTKFGLQEKAEALGAEVALLQGPGTVDVAALARQAVADGADLLGVAGGDGTQALVAGIAAEHRPAVPGDQRRDPQPLRPRPGAGPGGPGHLPGRPDRRGGAAGGPGHHRGPHVRQQRLVRRLRRGGAKPGLPRRQARHHLADAARPAQGPPRAPT